MTEKIYNNWQILIKINAQKTNKKTASKTVILVLTKPYKNNIFSIKS